MIGDEDAILANGIHACDLEGMTYLEPDIKAVLSDLENSYFGGCRDRVFQLWRR